MKNMKLGTKMKVIQIKNIYHKINKNNKCCKNTKLMTQIRNLSTKTT